MSTQMKQLFPTGEGKKEITCVLAGLDNAGKTTILHHIQKGEFISTSPTIGYDIEAVQIEGLQFNVFDLGGQVSFRSIWKNFLDRADVLIYVLDGSDRERLDESKEEFQNALQFLTKSSPVIILSNKKDLDNRLTMEEIMKAFNLQQVEKDRKVGIIETCALTSEGLRETFYWIYNTLTGRTIEQPDFHAPLECIGDGNFVCIWRLLQRCNLGPESCKACDIALCQNCDNFRKEICPEWGSSA